MEDLAEGVAKIFKALANPLRLKILALCLDRERSSRELREILGISKPLLIVHLKKLVELGLLEYYTELDTQRMIVRKFYRTNKNIRICLDEKILREINLQFLRSKNDKQYK